MMHLSSMILMDSHLNLLLNKEEFEKYMVEAKKLAKESRKTEANMNIQNEALLNFKEESKFTYDDTELTGVKVIGLFKDGKMQDEITDTGYVIFDQTCFYAESGGQVADIGAAKSDNFKAKVGFCPGRIDWKSCKIKIKEDRRAKIRVNHSMVHIIQKALQDNLSSLIHQAGSYVDDERLRFDFTYTGKITEDDILRVENKVNEVIHEHIESEIKEMPLEEAKKMGAMALFTDKYKDIVRVVKIGTSIELCGGTHIKSTDEIERFAILKVESKGSNLYRLEACTNDYVPVLISEAVAKYVDAIKRELEKAHNILEEAKKENIDLKFDVMLDQEGLSSYKDIIYNKNQLEYVQTEVRNLEKSYNEEKILLLMNI